MCPAAPRAPLHLLARFARSSRPVASRYRVLIAGPLGNRGGRCRLYAPPLTGTSRYCPVETGGAHGRSGGCRTGTRGSHSVGRPGRILDHVLARIHEGRRSARTHRTRVECPAPAFRLRPGDRGQERCDRSPASESVCTLKRDQFDGSTLGPGPGRAARSASSRPSSTDGAATDGRAGDDRRFQRHRQRERTRPPCRKED